MKILKIKLKNFASIYAGMNKREIEIDFTKARNKITLLVGHNGSGKTSILSNLHPFPYVESVDVRNTQDLILNGENGLKFMEIQDGKNHYTISINYLLQRDKRVTRCFIKKNGHELNDSGLVRSYYEIIKMEFGIEPSFLRILRLGPNVSDIIAMKSTERKDFISTFLADIDIYVKLFGVIKDESNYTKNQLKAVTLNYDKIQDITVLRGQEDTLKADKVKLETSLDKVKIAVSLKQQELASILSDDEIASVVEEYRSHQDLFEAYDAIKDEVGIDDLYTTTKLQYVQLENDVNRAKDELNRLSAQHGEYVVKSSDYEGKLALINAKNRAEDLDGLIDEYQSKLKDFGTIHKPLGTVEQYQSIYDMWKTITGMIEKSHDLHTYSIYKQYMEYTSQETVLDIISNALSEQIAKLSEEIATVRRNSGGDIGDILKSAILFIPQECGVSDICPYYNLIAEYEDKKESTSLKRLNETFDIYMDAKDNLSTFKVIQTYIHTINGMNLDIQLDFGELLLAAVNYDSKYFESTDSMIHEKVSNATDYALYQDFINKIDDLKAKKHMLDDSGGISFIKEEIETLHTKIDEIQSECDRYTETVIPELEEKLESIKPVMDGLTERHNTIISYRENATSYDQLRKKYIDAQTAKNRRQEIEKAISNYTGTISHISDLLRDNTYKLREIYHNIQTKQELQNQLERLQRQYEYTELIRESLSASKGIPLIFIQLYLKNIQILANTIIRDMFDDSIQLLDFIITEKEFSIPYMVNGIEIADVSYSSQGERTTIVLAISFALLQQSMGRYNILLLDEVDSALYKDNRRKFIKIVEEQMDRIGCEQAFMITHNSLFENYPVDIIQTSEIDDGYTKGHVIFKA